MGERFPPEDDTLSHGICSKCSEHFIRQWKGLDLCEYLKAFSWPVFVVDVDRRLIACNEPAEKALGWDMGAMRGLKTGEFMECAHARLPEGCGKTVHCRDCQLRISIAETIETGKAQVNVLAYQVNLVEGVPRTRSLSISTAKIGEAVAVTIEKIDSVDFSVNPGRKPDRLGRCGPPWTAQ